MILKDLIHGTYPVAVHCSGIKLNHNHNPSRLLRSLKTAQIHPVPDEICLLTWNSRTAKSPLELQCEHSGIGLTVLGRGTGNWRNGLKGELLLNFALSCEKPYIAGFDAYDLHLQGDLGRCKAELERAECEILFSGEPYAYPVHDAASRKFELDTYPRPFSHLNSGMMIAKTSYLREMARMNIKWGKCDQATWRPLHRTLWPKIKLDWQCRLFFNMHDHAEVRAGRDYALMYGPRKEG